MEFYVISVLFCIFFKSTPKQTSNQLFGILRLTCKIFRELLCPLWKQIVPTSQLTYYFEKLKQTKLQILSLTTGKIDRDDIFSNFPNS